VPLILTVFLKRVTHTNGPVTQILSIHRLYSGITRLEVSEVYESEPLGVTSLWVSHDFWSLEDNAEGTEGVVEKFLVYLRIQVADEQVGSDI